MEYFSEHQRRTVERHDRLAMGACLLAAAALFILAAWYGYFFG